MKRIILISFLFIFTSSYNSEIGNNVQKNENFEYIKEIQEIRDNLSYARKDLDETNMILHNDSIIRTKK